MSEYTTGALAKLSGVSVRTLQYYDQKSLLSPSSRTENGRRIYNDADLKRLKLILLLKKLGLSLDAIKEILASDNSVNILNLMLVEQEKALKLQLAGSKEQLKTIESIKRDLPDLAAVPIKSIDDINDIMKNKKSLRKVHITMIAWGIPIDIIEIGTLIYAIKSGNWMPFIIGMIVAFIGAGWISKYYFNNTNYICPNCNTEFKPKFWTAFWAGHNPRARKLTCPNCGKKDYCVEVFDSKN
ncbi:MerR family transcriptional regulator [Companilactobacillus sp.]|jgi:DNA-binding transcriptional MerR regulator/DNA-directed RNA polymerase subunit RPC12/RpoP|uniref:MerR family transcriptional regulator n=1 Tax=Companilactobacillus sp. TaxID=2767905 RepID=UPI0025B7E315|nr:MerR family transcriptional regulator [Companilactobacillus sp.]MCH4009362.1 MerR family transcriptional regulator [Companilactobacillus sp.]MCH4050459.1 MerR family transcriptional regulator [Companilactobacillus sp.]MCH4077304.1 MerR family transcriptional regulator [Companilactobacillus sp.]MCH4125880.1 MerR family transcriptional regulator [Companilactobacillus sp.]MCI1311589.1 MerR family transcriptional regulator [Companilactobacillus sp.]